MEPIDVHTTVIILLEAIIVVVEMAIYCLGIITPAQVSHFAVKVSFKSMNTGCIHAIYINRGSIYIYICDSLS